MFGYLRTDTPQLRVREERAFRGTYCGLCRTMGKCTGCVSRLTLSYDFTFLALVRLLASGETPVFTGKRCFLHPFRRRPMMAENGALRHCADCAAILNLRKAQDDIKDERGWRKWRARLVALALRPGYRRASKRLGDVDAAVSRGLEALDALERKEVSSVDLPASAFGQILRDIAAFGLDGSAARVAGEIGYHMGRWIYLADALDDRIEDARRGRYNPLIGALGTGILSAEQKETVEALLTRELMGIERALDLLERDAFPDGLEILKNMLYLGCPAVGRRVTEG